MPSKKPSPRLEEFVEEYFAYYRANRRAHSVRRHASPGMPSSHGLATSGWQTLRLSIWSAIGGTENRPGRSDVTINRELAFLRHVYSMAITWGKATENPVKKVRFAREDNGRVRVLSPEEETQLLAHCGPSSSP